MVDLTSQSWQMVQVQKVFQSNTDQASIVKSLDSA